MVARYSIISLLLRNLPILGWAFLAVCLTAAVMPVPNVSAAEVFTKDQGLQGSVVGVTAEGVEFETIYGKGAIVIPWVDVKRIRSDKEFLILYRAAAARAMFTSVTSAVMSKTISRSSLAVTWRWSCPTAQGSDGVLSTCRKFPAGRTTI
jgi:hypothetical protein